ncbi:MAG: hypothetical protein ABI600_02105 [Luteolibacter sp.]
MAGRRFFGKWRICSASHFRTGRAELFASAAELARPYTPGGYQVLKKWLSYRKSALLGRPLTSDEAQQFTHHVRRIASVIALHEELDTHYQYSIQKPFAIGSSPCS